MIRVLIADDEPMIRAGLRAVLATAADIEVVGEAGDGRHAVELARRHRPTVAVLDIRMPAMNGIEAMAELRRTVPATRVIILTTFGEDDYILRALGGGAAGFLIKSGEPEELIIGVRAVADGAAYLSPQVAARVVAHLAATGADTRSPGAPAPGPGSTPSAPGNGRCWPSSAAGCPTGRSPDGCTWSKERSRPHVSSILARLGVDNRAAAAVVAHEAGIAVPPPPQQ